MAKVFFQKDNISNTSMVGMFLNETQFVETRPLAYLEHYTVVECSDEDYNNFYTGKKICKVNADGTITSLDPINDPEVTEEKDFRKLLQYYINDLLQFKEQWPNHSKISEIDDSIIFANTINIEDLTFPTKDPLRYLIDNNKYINIRLI